MLARANCLAYRPFRDICDCGVVQFWDLLWDGRFAATAAFGPFSLPVGFSLRICFGASSCLRLVSGSGSMVDDPLLDGLLVLRSSPLEPRRLDAILQAVGAKLSPSYISRPPFGQGRPLQERLQ
ncbi:hypothetical protein PLESTB_000253400 [Pleodorina starrii]|uniref:Uncharacterized protein n=1 Tax=Pleodorina starrii TaxID=330485 RepID=A0A9W6EYX9_9CHLO|nr:hypothetical protein PLESTM_000472900 [Pleodorina starrii]GLC49546.1 hypothetical protein PLESTB_000253400 [Pleodorina starrii]